MRPVIATLFLSTLCLPALAADIEAVEVDMARARIELSGNDLADVTSVTITDISGFENTAKSTTLVRRDGTTIRADLPDTTPGVYRLRIYDGTTLEDELDITVAGAPRVAARSLVTQRTASNVCTGKTCTVVATCPSGFRVLSGGYRKVGYYDTTIEANYPSSATQWTVMAKAINSKAYFTEAEAHITCMRSE